MQENNIPSTHEIAYWDPGSFRDTAGSVFFYKDEVYRTINAKHVTWLKRLLSASFFIDHMNSGDIVTTSLEKKTFPEIKIDNAHVLKHEKIDFFTYPYE